VGEQPRIAAEGGDTVTAVSQPAPSAGGEAAAAHPGLALASLSSLSSLSSFSSLSSITARIEEDRWEGEIIAGKYRLEKIIGKGGMGVVVSGRHIGLDEPVAVKILRPAMMSVEGMVARFTREARAASKIKSEYVVRVMDVGQLEGGVPFMVMEHLDGIDLAAYRRQTGPLGVEETVQLVVEAADAIGEAHSLGIVHRDLKPANLFLTNRRDNRRIVKVLDFGISKVESADDTTRTGTLLGSPKYMSPEQMMSRRDVDGRADIWALGAILYELLLGRPPFLAETTPQICAMVLNSAPPKPRSIRADLPAELEAVILRCLEKSPDARFATVADLVRALLPFGSPALRASTRTSPAAELRAPTSTRASAPTRPEVVAPAAESSPLPTPMSTAMDATAPVPAAQPRFPAPAILGGLALLIAVGAAALLLGRDPPSIAAPAATTEPPIAAPVQAAPPGAEPPSAPLIPLSSVAAPRPSDAPIEAKKPPFVAPSPSISKPKPRSADPFGGTRN
jgi:serine/threonine-protein kinase